MYCSYCGKEIPGESHFCASCGKAIPGTQTVTRAEDLPAAPATVSRVVVAQPKRGGLLALKGFLLAILVGAIGVANLNHMSLRTAWMAVAFGLGSAYIIFTLSLWSRKKNIVKGSIIAWSLAVVLLFASISNLARVGTSDVAPNRGTEEQVSSVEPSATQGVEPSASTRTRVQTSAAASPASKLTPKQMREARMDYAAQFDQAMIKAGLESTTIVWGPDDTTLRVTYVLTSRVFANEFEKKLDFETLRALGFKKVELTNDLGGGAGAAFVWPVI
jgi:hypothetical protein